MIINRSKNTISNIIFGVVNKGINIILPFLIRTAIIQVLGAQYLGLNGLFTSILQMLNLAELGISSAITFNMYKPIAEDDKGTICALMKTYRKFYRIIGSCILAVGICLMPFLSYLINEDIPSNINLYALYLIFLINTVIGYWGPAYKSVLLNAHHQNGMISNVNSIICILQNGVQFLAIVVFRNYYAYILIMPFCTVINNVWISIIVERLYPHYKGQGHLDKQLLKGINTQVKGLIITKVCNTTRNAFDSIFISMFLGLTAVAMYGNYYYVMASVLSILSVISNAMIAGVGNSIALESVEKNYADMCRFNFIYSWISGICTVCLLCLYQPFVKMWLGDEMLYPMSVVIAFCLYFYCMTLGGIRAIYHDAIGLWWEARYRAIIESVLNIILNLVLTAKWGVLGTIIGTLISLVIVNYGYGTQIVFKYYFKKFNVREFFGAQLKYTVVIILSCILSYIATCQIQDRGIITLIVKGMICVVVSNTLYWLFYRKQQVFIESKQLVLGTIKRM